MKILVDCTEPEQAIVDAQKRGLTAKIVNEEGPSGWPEVAVEGDEAAVKDWLDLEGYGEGDYFVQ